MIGPQLNVPRHRRGPFSLRPNPSLKDLAPYPSPSKCGRVRQPHATYRAWVMSSTRRTLTPVKYMSISTSSTDDSRLRYRSMIAVSNGRLRSFGTSRVTSPGCATAANTCPPVYPGSLQCVRTSVLRTTDPLLRPATRSMSLPPWFAPPHPDVPESCLVDVYYRSSVFVSPAAPVGSISSVPQRSRSSCLHQPHRSQSKSKCAKNTVRYLNPFRRAHLRQLESSRSRGHGRTDAFYLHGEKRTLTVQTRPIIL